MDLKTDLTGKQQKKVPKQDGKEGSETKLKYP